MRWKYVSIILMIFLFDFVFSISLKGLVLGPKVEDQERYVLVKYNIIEKIISKMNSFLESEDVKINIKDSVSYDKNWKNLLYKNEADIIIGIPCDKDIDNYILPTPILSGRYILLYKEKGKLPQKVGTLKIYEDIAKDYFSSLITYKSLHDMIMDFCNEKLDGIFLKSEDAFILLPEDHINIYFHERKHPECSKSLFKKYYRKYWLFVAVNKNIDEKTKQALKNAIIEMYKRDSIVKVINDLNLNDIYLPPNYLTFAIINYPPYMIHEDEKIYGTDVDLIKTVSNMLGIKLRIVPYPPKRIFFSLNNGIIDGAFSMEKTSEREQFLLFTNEPISYGKDVLFYTDQNFNLKNLSNRKVSIVEGYTGDQIIKKLHAKVVKVKDDESGIKMVFHGRVYAHFTNLLAGLHYIKNLGYNQKIYYSAPLRSYYSYLAFPKTDDYIPFKKLYDTAIHNFKRTEEYSQILSKYGITFELMWKKQ